MAAQAQRAPGQLRGVHVLAMMIAFFLCVIGVNVAFMVFALDSFPGEDQPRSYLQGLHYNDTLAARAEQAALGWTAQASLSADGGEDVALRVRLTDAQGLPVDGLAIDGVLQWPADSRRDFGAVTLQPMGGGVYAASLGALAPGRWRLRAHTADGVGETFDFEAELQWLPSR
jgi:nitrogen fixation protein FixH